LDELGLHAKVILQWVLMEHCVSVSLFQLAQDRGHCLSVVNTVGSAGAVRYGQFVASCLPTKLWFDGLIDVVSQL